VSFEEDVTKLNHQGLYFFCDRLVSVEQGVNALCCLLLCKQIIKGLLNFFSVFDRDNKEFLLIIRKLLVLAVD